MPVRILLIDDEDIVLNAWNKALRSTGHTIFRARTKDEAIQIAGNESIDLVIVDYLMGTTTGIEILNLIRKKRPLVRSILISGQINSFVKEEAVRELIKDKVEVDLYLHKPVRSGDLRQAVAALLQNKQIDWQSWAKKVKSARDAKPEDATDAANRLKSHLKKPG
jgi:response regulator RpfG family c-di-GMP phosphodiesterase